MDTRTFWITVSSGNRARVILKELRLEGELRCGVDVGWVNPETEQDRAEATAKILGMTAGPEVPIGQVAESCFTRKASAMSALNEFMNTGEPPAASRTIIKNEKPK